MSTLIPTTSWLISPIADSGTRCKKCSYWLNAAENKVLRTAARAVTCSCGSTLSSSSTDALLGIRGDSARFCDKDATVGAIWYHATTSEDWDGFVGSGRHMVHLGTREAAMDRVKAFGDEEGPIFLYEIMLDEQAPVADTIFVDDDHWPSTPKECTEDYDVWSVFIDGINRYVNACEAPGSISLLTSTTYVRILDRVVIDESS